MNWIVKLDIKQYMNKDGKDNPQGVLQTAKEVCQELQRDVYAKRVFDTLPDDLVESVQDAVDSGEDYLGCCETFNWTLEDIYDVADSNGIWLGV